MATHQHTVEIERPIAEVFAFVTEPENYPKWQPSLLEVRPHATASGPDTDHAEGVPARRGQHE